MRTRRLSLIVVIVAALALGSWVNSLLPDATAIADRPYVRHGTIGQRVSMRTGDVTVTRVRTAHIVTTALQKGSTTGVWVVVDLTWTAHHEPSPLYGPYLVATDGRTYGGQQSVSSTCSLVQTEVPMRCQLAVEVAKDALAGAVLRFPAQLAGDETADDVVEIDPRWSAQDAASLASTSSTIALRQAEAAS